MDLTVTIGQYPLLFFSQGSIWHQVYSGFLADFEVEPSSHNILAMISSVSSEGNIGVILLWTSWLNIQTIYFGLYLFQSGVTVMQLAITRLPSTGLPVIIISRTYGLMTQLDFLVGYRHMTHSPIYFLILIFFNIHLL